MSNENVPKYFREIAVCLPGGGYRAAGFSLGILSMLHDCGLGNNIIGISTVSGGTITGAKYAQMLANSKPGEDYYKNFHKELYSWLLSDQLVTEAMSDLKKKHAPNLINAFALQYKKFIPGTFAEIDGKLRDRNKKRGGLKNIIFNATDFENGLQFRFRNDGDFGNGNTSIPKELEEKTQLGDIVAASSCFPGGFEPIIFPTDFMSEGKDLDPIALMDGGIIDNQGTSSLLTSGLKYDCVLIADAGGYKIEGFKPTTETCKTRVVSLFFNFWVLALLAIITVIFFYNKLYLLFSISCFFTSIAVVLQAILHLGLSWAMKTSDSNIPFDLPRNKLGIYLLDRVKSLVLMNSSIFLKSAKSRNISSLYKDHRNKASKLSIYELVLNPSTGRPHHAVVADWTRVTELLGDIPDFIQESSDISTNFGTTLWFDKCAKENNTLDHLVLTGRAVCCFNLVNHMVKNTIDNAEIIDNPLLINLVKLWQGLKPVRISSNPKCKPFSKDFKVYKPYA